MRVMIVFTCPNTGRDIPVAVVRHGHMLKEMQEKELEVGCLECGKTHTWKIGEGRAAVTEEPPAPMPMPARVA